MGPPAREFAEQMLAMGPRNSETYRNFKEFKVALAVLMSSPLKKSDGTVRSAKMTDQTLINSAISQVINYQL